MNNIKKYFKPEMSVMEFEIEDVLTASGITPPPVTGPVIEANEAIQELADAFSNVFDFGN